MARRHNFKELNIWKRSRILTKEIYLNTNDFPQQEQFGLTQQIRKSAVSISSNIAEGCGRGTNPQLVQFLNIAQGSAFELESQLYLSLDLEYLSEKITKQLIDELSEIQKMIDGFINKIK